MSPQTVIENTWTWSFPGGVAGLCAAAGILILLLAVSYVFTLRALPFRKKILPLLLRILFTLSLLGCLANPSRTTIRKTEISPELKIAVVFDESGSMQKPSDDGKTRLQDALSFYRNKLKPAAGKTELFAFGKDFRRIKSPDELPDNANADATRLKTVFSDGIGKLSAERFHGVIWLTDGIDTEGAQKDNLLAMAGGSALEHVFVPMTRRLPSEAELTFRKVEFPSVIQTGTDAQALFLIRCGNLSAQNGGVFELVRNNGEILKRETLPAGTGLHTIRCGIGADSVGQDTFTARLLLNGKVREQTQITVDKVKQGDLANVLIFNGAPDFGTRFIRNVFRENPEMVFDIRYAEGVFPRVPGKANAFPTAAELEKFDVLLLMNLRKGNLRQGAAADLDTFVRNGGGLLFVCGNPLTAREFASSELEKLLPVTFDPSPAIDRRTNAEAERMLNQMGETDANSAVRFDSVLMQKREFNFRPAPLNRFHLTETGKRSPLFLNRKKGSGELLYPVYQDSAVVKSVKPGTNVLATSPNGTALLAFQNYGAGRSMVLASDPLWRWKMNLPSDDTSFEIFWKNVFSYLASRRNPYTGFSVADASPVRKEWRITLDSRSEDPATLRCELERGGKKEPVALRREGSRTILMISPAEEAGTLRAFNAQGKEIASMKFSASSHSDRPEELRDLEPDLELFHSLASLSNVTLCGMDDELDPAQRFGIENLSVEERTDEPLWHTWLLFGVLLFLLCLEWVVRRFNNLL